MKHFVATLIAVSFGTGIVCAQFAEPPDAKINPRSFQIEIVDPVWAETNYDIRYVVNLGGETTTFDLATDPADDLRPRLDIAPNGNAWVAWWRDGATSRVLVRRHDFDNDSWSAEVTLGDPDIPVRNPAIACDGSRTWVAFEAVGTMETVITLSAIDDSPDPFGVTTAVAATTNQGPLDLQVHVKGGRLWVTWIDSASEIGWSRYDGSTEFWSLPAYEVYASQESYAALARIEEIVLGE